jgi:hypothetical protein
MIANNQKTKKALILMTCIMGVLALLFIGVTGGIAADQKLPKNAEIANAAVRNVNPDTGEITLVVDKNWKISGIDQGDEVEIVVQEETAEMQQQRPRKWRMMRHPYGGSLNYP